MKRLKSFAVPVGVVTVLCRLCGRNLAFQISHPQGPISRSRQSPATHTLAHYDADETRSRKVYACSLKLPIYVASKQLISFFIIDLQNTEFPERML